MAEQYATSEDISCVEIKLSKNILTIPDVDKYVAIAINMITTPLIELKDSPKAFDYAIAVCKFLKVKNLSEIIAIINNTIIKRLMNNDYDIVFLTELFDSSFVDICLNDDKMLSNNKSFDITDLTIKGKSHLTFDIGLIHERMKKYSYGFLDCDFINWLEERENISMCGGFLLGCIVDDVANWSDIDLFVKKDSDTKDLTELINYIEHQFTVMNDGIGNIVWSSNKNVITFYASDFKRNIQIIITDKDSNQTISEFDMDYVKIYYHMGKLHCKKEFLHSVMNRTVYLAHKDTPENRFVKAYLKGYIFSSDIIKKHPIVTSLTAKEVPDEHIKSLILSVTNKYYYPTKQDLLQKDYTAMLQHKGFIITRAEFMIKKIFNHTNIFFTSDKLLNHFKNYTLSSKNMVRFTSWYDDELIWNDTYMIFKIDNSKKLINCLTSLESIPCHKSFRKNFMIPVRTYDEDILKQIYFKTGIITLKYSPFYSKKTIEKYYVDLNICHEAFVLRIFETKSHKIKELFTFINNIDDYYHEIFLNNNIQVKDKNKNIYSLKNIQYYRIIKRAWYNGNDESKTLYRYIKFKLWIDKTNNEDFTVKTEFYKNDEQLPIFKCSDLMKLHEYIKKDCKIELKICFNDIYITNNHQHIATPRLYIVRIDIY
jgi:hypothetical protein